MKLSRVQLDRVRELKTSMAFDAFYGDYKAFKNAKKEYASLAVQDLESVKSVPNPQVRVPLFSKAGLRMMYVFIRDSFRIKTHDERLLKSMAKKEQLKSKINYQG